MLKLLNTILKKLTIKKVLYVLVLIILVVLFSILSFKMGSCYGMYKCKKVINENIKFEKEKEKIDEEATNNINALDDLLHDLQ